MAERGGFEPPIPFKGYTGLANQRLQPLGHLSKPKLLILLGNLIFSVVGLLNFSTCFYQVSNKYYIPKMKLMRR